MTAEGTVPVKLFSVLDIDCSDMTYCFGIINNGSSFCIKRNCSTKILHETVKMSFAGKDVSFVFIRRNIPGSVFSEPKLLTSKIPAGDVMSEWESKYLSGEEWTTEFQAIDGTNQPLTSAEEIQTETDFLLESSLLLCTPTKRKKNSFGGEEYYKGFALPDWKNRKYQRTFPEDTQELEDLIDEGVKKGVISLTVSKIESYIESLGDVLSEANVIHHDRLVNLENTIEVMIGIVQTMRSRIGSSVDIGERFTAPTLWGSTGFIADEITNLTEEIASFKEKEVAPIKVSIVSLITVDLDLSSQNEKVVRAVKLLLARVQAITETVDEVKTDLVMVRTEQGVRFSDPVASHSDPSDELMDFILSEERATSPDRGTRPSGSLVSPTKSSSLDEEDPEETMKSILAKLIDNVKFLQSGKQNTSIKYLADCSAWISKNFEGYQYGLIMGPLLMLDRIYREDNVTDSDAFLKAMETRYKMKIDSGNEAAALNALKYARPRVFHKGRPTIVSVLQNKSRLNLIPSHSDWNPGGERILDFCVSKLNELEEAITGEISETFEVKTVAQWIATKCLGASVKFLTQLFGCVDVIYKKLFNFSKFTTEQAWSLTTQVLDRILADLFVPRANISQSLKTRNTPTTCAQILLTVFKTHDIMATYVSHHFENHPSVSTEYVKFLATNSGSEKVVKLTETVEALKIKAVAALDEAKSATKKSDVATSKYSDLVKEVAALNRRIKASEDRK